MKNIYMRIFLIQQLIIFILFAQKIFSQGYCDPLTIQGLERRTLQSTASRAAGGTTLGLRNDIGLMFSNPSALQSLTGIQISVGAQSQYKYARQIQQYSPLKYYSNFSLLMEGLTGYISDPDSLHPGSNPGDTVQRPFDNIGPNWSFSNNQNMPINILLASPFSIGNANFVIGVGAIEYANLDNYFQNNNVLSPPIGSVRPLPIPLPPNNPDSTFKTEWFQRIRKRDGYISGFGTALSSSITENFSLGISGLILKGKSDDYELQNGRGTLVFFYNYFRLDSANFNKRITQTGSSKYSGSELTFSGIYRGRYVSLGFAVKPPTKITRKFSKTIQVDTAGSSTISEISGHDELRFPWQGTFGISIDVNTNFNLALEYELRDYALAIYKTADGTESKPWLSSSFYRVGIVYNATSWLTLYSGIQGQSEVFEPEGNALIGEPVRYFVYSAGCGLSLAGTRLNIAYEYKPVKYQDKWQTNVNLNNETYHNVVIDVRYEIPLNKLSF